MKSNARRKVGLCGVRNAALIALAMAPALSAAAGTESAPFLDRKGLRAAMDRCATAELRVDLLRLPDAERAALAKLVEAARVMDALYLRQAWGGNGGLLQRLVSDRSDGSSDRLTWFLWNKGPWSIAEGGKPFVTGVPPRPEAATFYPPGAAKVEVERWLASLAPAERDAAMGCCSVIRRQPSGRLGAVPYSVEYAPELARAAELLHEAAVTTRQPSLRNYLEKRATALLSNDYTESEAAFVDLDASVDAALGPYEVDDDGWFGAKAAFEGIVSVRDEAATGRLAALASQLQSLEDRLPIAPSLRGRRIAPPAPVQVLDLVYAGGQAANAILIKGYSLPNDPTVIARKGARTTVFGNALRAEFEATIGPVARRVLVPAQAGITFDDYLLEILLVRFMDGLGPLVVTGTSRAISDAMQDVASPAQQLRSMLLSLWAHEDLLERKVLDPTGAAALYPAFTVVAVGRLRGGLSGPQARASTVILNRLIDAGAIRIAGGGRLEVDRAKASASVRAQIAEVVEAQAAGDVATIRRLLRLAVLRPEVQSLVERLSDLPVRVRPVFVTAAELTSLAHP